MCEALDFVRAKVVTFLDYDDEYCERRLEKVKAWMLDQNTGYYHNSYVYIDERGAELSRASIKKRAKRVEDFQKRSLFKELLKEGAYANASSIAVSRKLLEDSKELLKRITAVPDLFLFCAYKQTRTRRGLRHTHKVQTSFTKFFFVYKFTTFRTTAQSFAR